MAIALKYNLNSNIYKANYNKLNVLLDLIKKKSINGRKDTTIQKIIALNYLKKRMNISNKHKITQLILNNKKFAYNLNLKSCKC